MTPALVTELKRLEREATAGPWEYGHKTLKDSGPPGTTRATRKIPTVFVPHPLADSVALQEIQEAERTWGSGHFSEGNAQLIVAMRNSLPALLEAVETMHAALGESSKLIHFFPPTHVFQPGSDAYELQGRAIEVWRAHGEAFARVAALLGEGREK